MIIGDKVILRPLTKEDMKKTINWRNDIEIKKLLMLHPFPITEAMENEWFENVLTNRQNKAIYFGLLDKKNEQLIGLVSLTEINWISRICKFGIIIGEDDARDKGFGKETVKLIINYVFNHLNLKKIYLEVIAMNSIAIRLYEKIGFQKEGFLKNHFYFDNDYHDIIIMSLFRQ